MIRKLWPSLLAALVSFAFALAMFDRLPDQVISNWGRGGAADGWMSRLAFVTVFPALFFVIACVLAYAPTWDSRGKNFNLYEQSYWLVVNLVLAFLALSHFAMTGINLGWNIRISWMSYGIAVLLMALGNVMTRIRPNGIFGVRTPWTLSSDRSWRETHRLAGYGTVLLGLVVLLSKAIWPKSLTVVLVGGLLMLSVISTAYSYLVWKKDTRQA